MAENYINRDRITGENDRAGISIEDLVRKARHGDSEAFSVIYREYVQPVYRYIYVRVNNDTAQAEDLTQEVFLKVINNLDSYHFRGKPFSSWIFRIAHNLVVDHYRKTGGNNTSDIEENTMISEDNPVASVERSTDIEELKKAIDTLPSQQKEVITLRFTNGLSVAETADAIGKTKGTVKKLQHVALSKLKKIMGR